MACTACPQRPRSRLRRTIADMVVCFGLGLPMFGFGPSDAAWAAQDAAADLDGGIRLLAGALDSSMRDHPEFVNGVNLAVLPLGPAVPKSDARDGEGPDGFGRIVADLLATDLQARSAGHYSVIERERLRAVVADIDAFQDETVQRRVATELGAQYLATGTYLVLGERLILSVRAVKVPGAGRGAASVSVHIGPELRRLLVETRGAGELPADGTVTPPPLAHTRGLQVVTNTEFRKFIEAGGYDERKLWTDDGWAWRRRVDAHAPAFWSSPRLGRPEAPVVGVSWYEAAAYARWLGAQLPGVADAQAACRAGGISLADASSWTTGFHPQYRDKALYVNGTCGTSYGPPETQIQDLGLALPVP